MIGYEAQSLSPVGSIAYKKTADMEEFCKAFKNSVQVHVRI